MVVLTSYTFINCIFFIIMIIAINKLARDKRKEDKKIHDRMDIIDNLLNTQLKEVLKLLRKAN